MKKFKLLLIVFPVIFQSSIAMAEEPAFSIYGISEEANDGDRQSGLGLDLDTEKFNLMIEGTAERYGISSSTKLQFLDEMYFKLGGAYASEKYYAEQESLWAKQYAFGGAVGYKVTETIYAEVGSIFTKLEKDYFSNDYVFLGEETTASYIEGVKRFGISGVLLDVSANYAYLDKENSDDTDSFGAGLDFYPNENTKFSAYYQDNDTSEVKTFSVQWNYLYAKYQPENEYVGLGIEFIWGAGEISLRRNLVKDISDNHRFENDMATNIEVKSRGIEKVESTDDDTTTEEDATNTAPTGQSFTYDASNASSVAIDVSSYTSDADGDTTSIDIVSSSVTGGDIVISSATASGETVNLSVSSGGGTASVIYRVYDGTRAC